MERGGGRGKDVSHQKKRVATISKGGGSRGGRREKKLAIPSLLPKRALLTAERPLLGTRERGEGKTPYHPHVGGGAPSVTTSFGKGKATDRDERKNYIRLQVTAALAEET